MRNLMKNMTPLLLITGKHQCYMKNQNLNQETNQRRLRFCVDMAGCLQWFSATNHAGVGIQFVLTRPQVHLKRPQRQHTIRFLQRWLIIVSLEIGICSRRISFLYHGNLLSNRSPSGSSENVQDFGLGLTGCWQDF